MHAILLGAVHKGYPHVGGGRLAKMETTADRERGCSAISGSPIQRNCIFIFRADIFYFLNEETAFTSRSNIMSSICIENSFIFCCLWMLCASHFCLI